MRMNREFSPTKRYYIASRVSTGEEGWYYRITTDVSKIGGAKLLKRASPPSEEPKDNRSCNSKKFKQFSEKTEILTIQAEESKIKKYKKQVKSVASLDDNINFFAHYKKILNTEIRNECARQEYLKCYYRLGEALESDLIIIEI